MFRYGGPIKEGVMNGIREPKRNGGSMGTRKAALVGNPVYPQTNGRENHYINFLAPVVAGAIRYGKPVLQAGKRIFGKTTPASVTKGSKFNRAQSVKEFGPGSGRATGVTMNPSKFDPNYLGRDPIVRTVGAIGKGIFSPTSKGVVAKAARFATAPSSIVAGVAYYMWPDGKERTAPPNKVDKDRRGTSDAPGGGDPGMYSTPKADQPEALTAEQIKENEAKARMEKMDSYREILDIKGMSKDAAYKSLIDASKIIQEGGNLKKQLKDGSLIQKVTAAASKNFNKVSDTETALRSLVAKGEITKDMNKEDKALSNELIRKKIAVADKQLSGDTFLEKVEKFTLASKGTPPSGATLANLMRTSEINVDEVADTTAVLNWLGKNKGKDEIDYIVDQVKVGITNGNPLDPGVYVVRDRIVIIDENGNVKPGPI